MSLLQLCKIQKFNEVSQLLQQPYDAKLLNEQDHSGRCALHYAVLANQKLVCQLLLQSGASPNIQDGQGNTPLHLALSNEKPNNCTQILCDSNYDWNLQDAFGRTAIHYICSSGYYGILSSIINININKNDEEKKMNDDNNSNKNKFNILTAFNLTTKSDQTCLHYAVTNKEWKCVELLLNMAGNGYLDLTIRDKNGMSAYDLCLDEHQKQLIWDKTKIQIKANELKKKENDAQKFVVNTMSENKDNTNTSNKNKKNKNKLKGKGRGKKKMKIKLKK